MKDKEKKSGACAGEEACLTRRSFLIAGGSTLVTVLLSSLPGMSSAKGKIQFRSTRYPRRKIGSLRELKTNTPMEFHYPHSHPNCAFMLIRLGREAAGGVGPDKDIVAFSKLCTHMGSSLNGLYKPEFAALGPCPMHLTVFDLRRHGMVATGHATQSLPQTLLEIDGDDIYAIGVLGLIYGFHDNTSAITTR